MTETELERIVIKIGEEKPNLRIKGGEKLHPIYEAVLALLKQHLSDEQIVKRMNNESDLKKIIAIDSFIDIIPEGKKAEFIGKINSIKDYNEIFNWASLYIAENKRMQNGNALEPVSDFEMPKYILKAIKKAKPEHIFINRETGLNLEERAKKIRKRRIAKIWCSILFYATIGAGIYFNKETIIENANLIYHKENLKSEIQHLENDYSKLQAEVERETGLKVTKGFQIYEMLPKEFDETKEKDAVMKKIESIQKTGDINQVTFIYEEGDVNKVKFFYNKK